MQDTPEHVNPPPVDPFVADKAAYEQAKNIPVDPKSALRAIFERVGEIAAQAKQELTRMVNEALGRSPGPIPGDVTREADLKHKVEKTAINVKELLKVYKEDPLLIPKIDSPGGKVVANLVQMIPNLDVMQSSGAVYLYEIVRKAINDEFNNPLEAITREELLQLKAYDQTLFGFTKVALFEASFGLAPEQDRQNFMMIGEAAQQQIHPEEAIMGRRDINDIATMTPEELQIQVRGQEYAYVLGAVPIEFHNLVHTLYNRSRIKETTGKTYFASYLDDVRNEVKKSFALKEKNFDTLSDEQKNKEISKRFSNNIVNLVGKLYEKVDRANPDDFWEEAEQRGGFWSGTRILSESLETQIQALSDTLFTPEELGGMKFYFKKAEEYDRQVAKKSAAQIHGEEVGVESRRGEHETYYESRLTTEPFSKYEEAHSFKDYISSVLARSIDQKRIRQALHNCIALIRQPKQDQEAGFMGNLEKYVGKFLPNSYVDLMSTDQPDADLMLQASALLDAFTEAEYAKYNWEHQSGMDQLDPTRKIYKRGLDVEQYLRLLDSTIDDEGQEWRGLRALMMAIGDNHAISLRRFEHGARAVPPTSKGGLEKEYSSYGEADAYLFMSLYPQAHWNMRLKLDDLSAGNLIYMPVEGKNLRKLAGSMVWDHRNLKKDMIKSMTQFKEGRTVEDEENGTRRLIDIVNIGAVGGIYTRGGWRFKKPYEAFLPLHQPHANILQSWKAIENIGVEIMKDFTSLRIEELNSEFYEHEGHDQRRELVDYMYRRYFRSPGRVITDAEVSGVFSNLEKGALDEHGLKKNYTEFYYKVLTHAIKQRRPTKFLRYEANREVVGRDRAWEVISQRSGMKPPADDTKDTRFETAVKDIILAEVKLRSSISERLIERYDPETRGDTKLYDVDVRDINNDYELTREELEKHLNTLLKGPDKVTRMTNALRVYDETINFVDNYQDITGKGKTENYLDNFAKKYKEGLPFALMTEELERRFLVHRASGEGGPKRALEEMKNAENMFTKVFNEYFVLLQQVSINGKKDFHPLVAELEKVFTTMKSDGGEPAAYRLIHHLGALTTQFFMQDTVARNILTKPFTVGGYNSLAAEFAGSLRGVWEWDKNDANNWVNALEAARVLPKEPFEVSGIEEHITKPLVDFEIPFTKGKRITFGKKIVANPEFEYSGKNLRSEFGIDGPHIFYDQFLNKIIPMLMAFIIWKYIQEALKESQGQKR